MFNQVGDDDTICALSTPPGAGGIAVIRVSGANALTLVRRLCRFLPQSPDSHRIFFGTAKEIDDSQAIDEVLCSFFADGHSYTGEEIVEISCHGGKVPSSSILRELVKVGCRMARRGEFTYRAFMNGRLDLVQAEGVLSLIESQSKPSAKMALRQLQGRLSMDFNLIEDGLVWILAHLEASIDFSSEGIEVVPSNDLINRSQQVLVAVDKLIKSYDQGRILQDGLQVVLVGRPNVGKSSLLNALLNEERAIVTAQPGTTRDTVEGQLSIQGVPVSIIDTAGIRETEDEIERLGIARSRNAMDKSDVLFFVSEINSVDNDLAEFSRLEHPEKYLLVNKIDTDSTNAIQKKLGAALAVKGQDQSRIYWVSAKTGQGLEQIESDLKERVLNDVTETTSAVTQARHVNLLQKIHSCLHKAIALIIRDESPEFIAFELQEAIRATHEILGKEFNEQIIDRIFKEFCLGK